MRMLDFSAMGYPVGMMVERSAQWQETRFVKGKKPQVGIIIAFKIYNNMDKTQVQAWPVVAWEGCRTGESTTNPCLVDAHRPRDKKIAKYLPYFD